MGKGDRFINSSVSFGPLNVSGEKWAQAFGEPEPKPKPQAKRLKAQNKIRKGA